MKLNLILYFLIAYLTFLDKTYQHASKENLLDKTIKYNLLLTKGNIKEVSEEGCLLIYMTA